MSISQLLLALAGPMVLRVLTLLGIGTLTFTGVTAGVDGLIAYAQSSFSALPSAILSLASLAGVPQGLGIVAGAISGRVGLWVAVSATRWVTSAP